MNVFYRNRSCSQPAGGRSPSIPDDPQSGIALIIVMISILVLAILAGGFAYSMKVETKLARNGNNETELEWLGRSGVDYARWVLVQHLMCGLEPYDSLSQTWAGGSGTGPCSTNGPLLDVQSTIQLGSGKFTWKITDLERKFNINLANEEILRQALVVMGADAGEFPGVVGSILDWIDPDDVPHIQGTESDYYLGLNPPYEAKNGPIDDLSELLLVRGITSDMYSCAPSTNRQIGGIQRRLNPFGPPMQASGYATCLTNLFTPLGTGKININTASAEVLQLIPGLDAMCAEAIVGARSGEDDGSGLTGPYRTLDQLRRVPCVTLEVQRRVQQYCDVRSKTFEISVTAEINGYKRDFVAIVGRNNPRDIPVLTFYWR